MAKYKKKPVIIEAVQYHDGQRPNGVCNCGCIVEGQRHLHQAHVHTIHDNQAVILADGDWILPESDGKHFYPCKPDIFAANYEPANDV